MHQAKLTGRPFLRCSSQDSLRQAHQLMRSIYKFAFAWKKVLAHFHLIRFLPHIGKTANTNKSLYISTSVTRANLALPNICFPFSYKFKCKYRNLFLEI